MGSAFESAPMLARSASLAVRLLSCADSASGLDVLLEAPADSFWSDDEDIVDRWNTDVAVPAGWPAIALTWSDPPVLKREGLPREWKLVGAGDRDDGLRVIHALSRATTEYVAWRYCRDSEGQSEQSFIALAPSTWAELEARFGSRRVRERLLRLPARFDAFMDKAFAAPAGDGATPVQWCEWDEGLRYQPASLNYVNLDAGDGRWHLDRLAKLATEYLDSGAQRVRASAANYIDAGSCREAVSLDLVVDRDQLHQALAPFIGGRPIRVSSPSLRAFLLIESNAVAAAWRVA